MVKDATSTFLTFDKRLDVEAPSDEASESESTQHGRGPNIVPSSAGSMCTAVFLIVGLGMLTSGAFVALGVNNAIQDQNDEFTRAASDTTNKIQSAFKDYVNAASTIHMRCRHRNFTRHDFREQYEYLVTSGLHFKAVQFDPNITHEERKDAEDEARDYYARHYPHVNYLGIRGFNYPNSTSLEPRIGQPFYFPIHYMEPIEGNEAAIDLDYYSSESRRRAVDALFATKEPSLTDRLSLVKKAGQVSRCGSHNGPSFGVVLMHPGVELSNPQPGDDIWPKDFSSIVLCIPDLLERSTTDLSKMSALVYVHDMSHPSDEPVFMGGARVLIEEGQKMIDFLEEEDLADLTAKLVRQSTVVAANREWIVTVLSMQGTYEPDGILFIILGGCVVLLASILLAVWVFTSARRTARYNRVLTTAERSTAIVTSLFPQKVAEQMLDYDRHDREGKNSGIKNTPIADLFPATTVMFADMVGFTAWSSMRDPISVFVLLETIYNAFDMIAARRNVFKVETVGDCYVAVCGLPEPRKDHAVVMARFAHDCARKVKHTTRSLEVHLGPDTSTLDFRFGLHSGPVIGGVLRGQRARFQLFGDTVNCAARIEATGIKGQIQMSTVTANLLVEAGKGHWVVPRHDKVLAKGIGVMQTAFLTVKPGSSNGGDESESACSCSSLHDMEDGDTHGKHVALVDWHTETLAQFLKVVVAENNTGNVVNADAKELTDAERTILKSGRAPISEITEHLLFPAVQDLESVEEAAEEVELGAMVMRQLSAFIWEIESSYRSVPFHNFLHASHVVMSVIKLLGSASNHKDNGLDDPLARFTLVLAAIVHDVDHPGVPNGQLNNEENSIAMAYDCRSAAEQNSLDITWKLLMKDEFKELRRTIYRNKSDLFRFRGLLVHTVLVTDIVNKELQSSRKLRWNKVFGSSEESAQPSSDRDQQTEEERLSERKTALLELVIQASDVSHTMQHWHIYRQWNTCLFHEMDAAWRAGRAEKDPTQDWYQGEIGFFKFYILPLADRVKHSSAFGALGTELYHCAESNMLEWQMKGIRIVDELGQATADKNLVTYQPKESCEL